MKGLQKSNWNIWYPAALAILAVLALMHLLDVRAGVTESGQWWMLGRYYALAAVGIVAAAGAGAAFFCERPRRVKDSLLFFFTAMVLGMLYLYVLPPLSAPDEARHFITAYDISNRILGVSAEDTGGLVPMRAQDWFIEDSGGDYDPYVRPDGILAVDEDGADGARILGQTLTAETYCLIHENWPSPVTEAVSETTDGSSGETGQERMVLSIHHPVVTTPCVYIAPALGITLARVLGLNSLWLAYLGRLCNLLLFAVVTALAIRRLPFGKEVLFGTALLPMTIHLSASYSYDGVLMAGVFYFTAICMDLAFSAERVRLPDVVQLALVMALVGPCKMVYAVFMGLCLLIPVKKFGGWGRWLAAAGCVLGAWCLVMLIINGQTVASYASGGENYIDWAAEAGYSLPMLIHQPLKTIQLFFNTVVWQAETWHLTMIGAYLGNVDLVLDVPYLAVVFFTGALIVLSLRKPGDTLYLTGIRRLWVWVLCLICSGALMLSMLLAWTPVSSRVICGVQGRYFLPFLPVFLMTVKNDRLVLTKNSDRTVLYLMFCGNIYVALRIYSIVCMRL